MIVLGIDFGSQSLCACLSNNDTIKANIIRNNLSLDITPCAVAYFNGERFVGDAAFNKKSAALSTTIDSFTDLMGITASDYSSSSFQVKSSYLASKLQISEEGSVKILMPIFKDETKYVHIEFFASMLLNMLKDFALTQLSGDEKIEHYAISVPGKWSKRSCKSLLDAAHIAGFKNVHLVKSTTAAAHLYGTRRFYHRKKDEKKENEVGSKIMLIDQGYSFLSITIVEYMSGKGKVLAELFENIGGGDADKLVWQHFADKIAKENGIKLLPASKVGVRLLQRVEKAKHILSTVSEARVEVENLLGDRDYKLVLSRGEFDKICSSLVIKLKESIEKVLVEASLSPSDIAAVELVGGSTRGQYVQKAIEDVLGPNKLGFKLDSTSVTSEGAAILGSIYFSKNKDKKVEENKEEDKKEEEEIKKDLLQEGFALENVMELSVDGVDGLNEEDIAECIELEKKQRERDAVLQRIEEARNALEAFIYDLKSKASENAVLLPSSVINPLLEEEENWLYSSEAGDSIDDSLFKAHLTSLKESIKEKCPAYYSSVEEKRIALEATLEEESKKALAEKALEPEEDHDNRKMKFPDRMRIMKKNKEEGTELFKDGNFAHAANRYVRALSHGQKFFDMSPEQKKEVDDVKLALCLNLAQCYLKLQSWDKAVDNCKYALDIDGNSVKALYRRSTAYYQLKKFDEALADLKSAQKLDPEDVAITKLMEKVNLGLKKEADRQKSMAKKMFG